MKDSTTRLALIGAGGMANSVHYPSLAGFDDVELAGLCDLDGQKLEATAKKFDIGKTFTDYRRMLDEIKPDAVYVLMPPHVLFDVAAVVLHRGHDLFIEKPPGVTTFQAESLAALAEQNGCITGVGFQRRYHPMVHHLWEEVRKRGELHQLTVSFFKNQAPTEIPPYYRGSIDTLHCDAIHAVDSLRYYAGLSPVQSVQSVIRKLDCWYDSSYAALVTFENGVVGTIFANWRTGRRLFSFEFHAYNASCIADIDERGRVWADNSNDPVFDSSPADYCGSTELYVTQGFQAEARAFVNAVQSRKALHNSIRDGAESMRLADRIISEAVR